MRVLFGIVRGAEKGMCLPLPRGTRLSVSVSTLAVHAHQSFVIR